MGYQEKKECGVNVVASLTDVGRRLLLQNPAQFEIDSFIPFDTGIDYRLWNTKASDGFDSYGKAIEAMPCLEPIANAEAHLFATPLLKTADEDVTNKTVINTDPITVQAGIELEGLGAFVNWTFILENQPQGSSVTMLCCNSNPLAGTVQVISGGTAEPLRNTSPMVNDRFSRSVAQKNVSQECFWGQSNMVFQMSSAFNDTKDMLGKNATLYSTLTFMEMDNRVTMTIPVEVSYNAEDIKITSSGS